MCAVRSPLKYRVEKTEITIATQIAGIQYLSRSGIMRSAKKIWSRNRFVYR